MPRDSSTRKRNSCCRWVNRNYWKQIQWNQSWKQPREQISLQRTFIHSSWYWKIYKWCYYVWWDCKRFNQGWKKILWCPKIKRNSLWYQSRCRTCCNWRNLGWDSHDWIRWIRKKMRWILRNGMQICKMESSIKNWRRMPIWIVNQRNCSLTS